MPVPKLDYDDTCEDKVEKQVDDWSIALQGELDKALTRQKQLQLVNQVLLKENQLLKNQLKSSEHDKEQSHQIKVICETNIKTLCRDKIVDLKQKLT